MPERSTIGHETRDISARLVAWLAIGLAIAGVIIYLAMAALYGVFKREHPSLFAASRIEFQPRMIAPPPRLQTNAPTDLDSFRAAEDTKLNSYGWLDQKAGVVRIPIERAMDLIAQRGLPTRGSGAQNGSGKTPEDLQREKAAATSPNP